ncbi:hypothetical protein [Curtobacterium aetherium]|uniref:Uncharacterized protein n=1 Tax=Curtobacterium aetherium TaxID=2841594 RepID=A0ACD1E4K7_9MICO|nr:hypothetical protein [Curtobacterium sp. L6-1]QWS33676.1 hypothetical protein KM842_00150 [Curtobacterium sp. L6-1]
MTIITKRALHGAAIGTAVAVVLVGTGVVGSTPAQAVLDASAPVLSSVTVSNPSPSSGSIINETVGASDVGTGIDFIVVSIRDEVGKTHTIQGSNAGDLRLPIDSSWAVGPAQVTDITIFDSADNYAVYRRNGSATVLENGSFTFQGHTVDFSAGDFTISEKPAVVPFDQVSAPLLVAGTAQVGGTMTALPGAWTPTPTTTSLQWFADGRAIQGETRSELALTAALAGKVITVAQTGSRSGYVDQTVVSQPSPAVRPGSFDQVSAPLLVAGTAQVGGTMTALPGAWTPTPTTTSLQWFADGRAIQGETRSELALTAALAGKVITVAQTGSRSGYVDQTVVSQPSPAVRPAPAVENFVAPSISGAARVGETLVADVGRWEAGTTFRVQWSANDERINGANGLNLILAEAQRGKVISVAVTGVISGRTDTTAVSSRTVAVSAPLQAFVSAVPTIVGTPRDGSILTARVGTWTPAPTTWKYQWLRDGQRIAGATKSTFTVPTSAVGAKLSVVLTGSRAGYGDATVSSAESKPVAPLKKLTATPKPKISGTVKVGKVLTVSAGKWSPAPVALTYQWSVNGTAIVGATKSTVKIPKSAGGKTITVTVTGKKDGYVTVKQTSAKTGKVAK